MIIPVKLVLANGGAGIYLPRHSRHFLSGIYLGFYKWIPATDTQV
jgi:hypothetical protein